MPLPAPLRQTARRLDITLGAAAQLGPRRLAYLLLYRIGLKSGAFRRGVDRKLAARMADAVTLPDWRPVWRLPETDRLRPYLHADQDSLLAEMEALLAGQVRLFGALEIPLIAGEQHRRLHWTAYESGRLKPPSSTGWVGGQSDDIKLTWEPMRFGWVYSLGRAYCLTGDERLARRFWEGVGAFLDANPPYDGPHWASAQEVGIRLIALVFGLEVFEHSPESSPERRLRLLKALAAHAGRIPPTLAYAQAQNNNHLLSEAAALATAGTVLCDHPQSRRWRRLGWRLFNEGLHSQIAADGAYCQHSANYHRLMLQLGLWMAHIENRAPDPEEPAGRLDALSRERLAAATDWLLALLDPDSGRVPNLGPNDGAYLLPLAAGGFEDYRPVLQAAGLCFHRAAPLPAGPWDEMSLWLAVGPLEGAPPAAAGARSRIESAPLVIRSSDGISWAYLRAARFTSRPGHADQLHLDLWFRGVNLALDPGTYQYNADPPWDNSLTASTVHNTVTVDGRDQMRRAGRFLYLDWAQARSIIDRRSDRSAPEVSAEHDGYRAYELSHRRTVRCLPGGIWEVADALLPLSDRASGQRRAAALHWLFPDWTWEVELLDRGRRAVVGLVSPFGPVRIELSGEAVGVSWEVCPGLQIVRAGEILYGPGPALPIHGWASPTYAVKYPALSVCWVTTGCPEIRFLTRFILPGGLNPAEA